MKIIIQLEANDDGRIRILESEDDFNKFVAEIDNRLHKIGAIKSSTNDQEKPRQLTIDQKIKILRIATRDLDRTQSLEHRFEWLANYILNFKEQANREK